jgi:hypothetical protein
MGLKLSYSTSYFVSLWMYNGLHCYSHLYGDLHYYAF